MSWTNECTESNVFKVVQPQEVKEVLELMGFCVYENEEGLSFSTSGEGTFFDENTEVVLSLKPCNIEGEYKNLIGIISDLTCDSIDLNTISKDYGLKENEYMVTPIMEYLQEQLLDKEYITITCAGFESRCSGSFSPFGDITIITKNNVNFESLANIAYKFLNENTK